MKAFFSIISYQLLIFLRLKEALFFIWMFPLLLFVVFGLIWGWGSEGYIPFILTGVMGMIITNEGFYSIGGVVKEYYANGLIRYLSKFPTNIMVFFMGYLVSRFISLAVISSLLCIVAQIVFNYHVSLMLYLQILTGAFIGILTLGFLGLCISFSGIKRNSTTAVMNIIGYFMLFTSNAFYPLSEINEKIALVGNIFPLNSILDLMRNGHTDWTLLATYTIVSVSIFLTLYKYHRYSR